MTGPWKLTASTALLLGSLIVADSGANTLDLNGAWATSAVFTR
jgi:hypothetical protein